MIPLHSLLISRTLFRNNVALNHQHGIQQWVEIQKRVVDLPMIQNKEPLPDVIPVNGLKKKIKAISVQGFQQQWKKKTAPLAIDPDDDAHTPDKGLRS